MADVIVLTYTPGAWASALSVFMKASDPERYID